MQFLLDKSNPGTLFEQAREQIITALHMGKLRPGERLPSVRLTAQRNNINLKTAFAIYQRLRDDGYLELKTGSGAYVSNVEGIGLDQTYRLSVFELIKANVAQAARLDLTPDEYGRLVSRFVDKSRTRPAQIGVIECNEEQVNVFSDEISSRLRVRSHAFLLGDLAHPDRKAAAQLSRMDYLVTTDYHFKDVCRLTHQYNQRILKLRLNPGFVPQLVKAAKRGRLLMVVSNTNFFEAFQRNLLGIGTPASVLDRIFAVDDKDPAQIRAAVARARVVYVSPVCNPEVEQFIRRDAERLDVGTMLSDDSIEMIEAALLFEE
jgi:DNA-binding transcriptional regulator YhcF (GntR family)